MVGRRHVPKRYQSMSAIIAKQPQVRSLLWQSMKLCCSVPFDDVSVRLTFTTGLYGIREVGVVR